MRAKHNDQPTEAEIEDYLTKDLMIRKARGESADEALDANYEFGLRLRQAIDAKYPPRHEPPARSNLFSRLKRGATIVVAIVVVGAVGWLVNAYFGRASIPYVALVAVLVVYGYFQTKLEDLQIEANVNYDELSARIEELEATIKGPELERILQDFEATRDSH